VLKVIANSWGFIWRLIGNDVATGCWWPRFWRCICAECLCWKCTGLNSIGQASLITCTWCPEISNARKGVLKDSNWPQYEFCKRTSNLESMETWQKWAVSVHSYWVWGIVREFVFKWKICHEVKTCERMWRTQWNYRLQYL